MSKEGSFVYNQSCPEKSKKQSLLLLFECLSSHKISEKSNESISCICVFCIFRTKNIPFLKIPRSPFNPFFKCLASNTTLDKINEKIQRKPQKF